MANATTSFTERIPARDEELQDSSPRPYSPEQRSTPHADSSAHPTAMPSLEPYVDRLERFELFSTNQCYYLIGCNKQNTAYRVLKMDRTLIERPSEQAQGRPRMPHPPATDTASGEAQAAMADNSHTAKPTLRPLSEVLTEDPNVYTQEEISDVLDMIHDGNRAARADGSPSDIPGRNGGGLKPLVKAYGIVGFIRFLDCYYLTLITRRTKVGSIGGNGIYTIKNTETVPLKPSERSPGLEDHADPSSVLLSMWNRGKRSVGLGLTNREIAELRYQGLYQVVDLTKNFFFSYTYDLTRSLQENFLATTTRPFPPPPFKDMYAWNYFLTREFEVCLNSLTSFHWIMPIIHGAFAQRTVNDYGRTLNLILIARRSRHFAGTRYLKRGVSEQGKVANDVEHEQIVHDESTSPPGIFSSYLQVRGSIPTYWTQESSVTMPKPPIEINRVDPTYTATQSHFEDLFKRYSSPVIVLDLVKQSEKREREVRVGDEFRHAISYINDTIDSAHKIRYCALDYSHISKHRSLDVSSSLNDVSTWAVNQTGFFCSSPRWKITRSGIISPFTEEDAQGAARLSERLGIAVFPMEQHGVLRTNCIDCLDRTNVAQFSAGVEAIGQQLVVMGIRSKAVLGPTSTIVRELIEMYVDIGDSIALQYGGSEAHKKVTAERTESIITGPIGKHKELLTSIRRYYSNAFTDRLKQDAMNLFLGSFVPYRHSIPLWELESDYYLHNFHVKSGKGATCCMKMYQRAFGIETREEEKDSDDEQKSYHRPPSSPKPGHSNLLRPESLHRDVSADSSTSKRGASESKRVVRVRKACNAQKEALSSWWKAALQANIQQRMWMQLGHGDAEGQVPPRFERIYQPDKLGQFDRFFARGWVAPVRRSHAAQHSEVVDDGEGNDLMRQISPATLQQEPGDPIEPLLKDSGISLKEYEERFGLRPLTDPSLNQLLSLYSGKSASGSLVGSDHETARMEYLRYLTPANELFSGPLLYREETVQEFTECLKDYTIDSDDVAGVYRLAESAHLSEIIQSGPYKGLSKHHSAIEVATAIHEQFGAFDAVLSDGDHTIIETELRRRGLDSAGVRDFVSNGLDRLVSASRNYSEIESSPHRCRRCDLTTIESLALYASSLNYSSDLSEADLIFLLDRKSNVKNEKRLSSQDLQDPNSRPANLAKKAIRHGISIIPHDDLVRVVPPPYEYDRNRKIPPGFEQINEDFFSWKDNRFIVFNGAALDSWQGTQPITKISPADSILLSTIQ